MTALKRFTKPSIRSVPVSHPSRKPLSSIFRLCKAPLFASYFSTMAQRGSDYLVWVDLEMTGLNIDKDHIIEMAVIVTDKDLNVIAEVRYHEFPNFRISEFPRS